MRAIRIAIEVVASRGCRSILISTSCPGLMNVRIFTSVTRVTRRRAPGPRELLASASSSSASSTCSSRRRVPGNTGRRGKWSSKYGAEPGTWSVAASDVPGTRSITVTTGRRSARESRGPRAGTAEHLEIVAHGFRRVELLHRQHRPDAIPELEHRAAADARKAAVGDRVLVTGLEIDCKVDDLSRRRARQEQRFAGKAGNRAAAKTVMLHRDPGCELADRFGDEARRERAEVARGLRSVRQRVGPVPVA